MCVIGNDMLTSGSQGLTTAAQKLNRKGILKQYEKEVDRAYGRS
jgi:hypothetical protein